ncbi:MAG: 3'-5' exonuclease [Rhodothermales bacterium]
MRLERPLLFFDLETTGLDVEKDRIVEIACIKVHPDKRQERFETFLNPERPIPPEVTELTGITDEMVAAAPLFREIADTLGGMLRDADLAGYNAINFDVPMLQAEFKRAGVVMPAPADRAVLDPLTILKKYEVRTLGWAHAFYLGQEMPRAHRSMDDTEAAMTILREQIKRYQLTGSPRELQDELRKPYLDDGQRFKLEGETVMITFGKYRNKALSFVRKTDPDYLKWMRDTMGPEVAAILDQYR